MAQLPQEQKAKIAEQVASFQEEKSKLDAEVSKWDDSGNDIIVLAKQMCMIMMEMTDFTRSVWLWAVFLPEQMVCLVIVDWRERLRKWFVTQSKWFLFDWCRRQSKFVVGVSFYDGFSIHRTNIHMPAYPLLTLKFQGLCNSSKMPPRQKACLS